MSGPIRLILVVVIVCAILAVLFDLVSPTLTERTARNNAYDVAAAGAHVLLAERTSPFDKIITDARAAANRQAVADNVTLIDFHTDAKQVVHVTIVRQARSLVTKYFQGLKKFDTITVSASATP